MECLRGVRKSRYSARICTRAFVCVCVCMSDMFFVRARACMCVFCACEMLHVPKSMDYVYPKHMLLVFVSTSRVGRTNSLRPADLTVRSAVGDWHSTRRSTSARMTSAVIAPPPPAAPLHNPRIALPQSISRRD